MESVNYFAGIIFAHLVNAVLPGAVAIGLTSLLAWRKRWNAASRYCAWWLMLGLLAVLPFVPEFVPGLVPGVEQQAAPAGSEAAALRSQTAVFTAAPVARAAERILPSPVAVFLFCWLAAACLQLLRVVRGLGRGARLKRSSRDVPEELAVLFAGLLERTGVGRTRVRRTVTIGLSDSLESPALLGYWRPRVLLPAGLVAQLEWAELEQVLLHELAHVERWDDWTIVLQRTAEAVGVFHPLVAYLAHRMNLDREMACDDAAAVDSGAGKYAACLARVAEMRQFGEASPVTAPLLLERKSELLERVESLLDGTRAHVPGVPAARVALLLSCAATVGVAGAFTPRFLESPAAFQQVPAAPAAPSAPGGAPSGPGAAPSAPEAPAAPASRPTAPAPPAVPGARARTGSSSLSSIAVIGEDGSTSNFGSRSGDEKGEPGTITYSSGGKRYVIRDRSAVAEAERILNPMEELGKKQELLGEKQEKLGEQQSALGAKQEALAMAPLDSEAMKQLQEQLRQLESRLHQIDIGKEMKTAEEAMSKLGEVQEKIGDMQARMGSAQGLRGEKQGELGDQQGKLGEEQGRLGEQQGKLGEQQGRASQLARRQLEELIRRAQQRGLAEPVR